MRMQYTTAIRETSLLLNPHVWLCYITYSPLEKTLCVVAAARRNRDTLWNLQTAQEKSATLGRLSCAKELLNQSRLLRWWMMGCKCPSTSSLSFACVERASSFPPSTTLTALHLRQTFPPLESLLLSWRVGGLILASFRNRRREEVLLHGSLASANNKAKPRRSGIQNSECCTTFFRQSDSLSLSLSLSLKGTRKK